MIGEISNVSTNHMSCTHKLNLRILNVSSKNLFLKKCQGLLAKLMTQAGAHKVNWECVFLKDLKVLSWLFD